MELSVEISGNLSKRKEVHLRKIKTEGGTKHKKVANSQINSKCFVEIEQKRLRLGLKTRN